MSKPLEPPQFQAALVKQSAFMNDPWANWVRNLFEKIKELEARIKVLEGP